MRMTATGDDSAYALQGQRRRPPIVRACMVTRTSLLYLILAGSARDQGGHGLELASRAHAKGAACAGPRSTLPTLERIRNRREIPQGVRTRISLRMPDSRTRTRHIRQHLSAKKVVTLPILSRGWEFLWPGGLADLVGKAKPTRCCSGLPCWGVWRRAHHAEGTPAFRQSGQSPCSSA